MDCLYCKQWNPDDEPRCQRCGRRLLTGPARSGPEYVGSAALATAVAPATRRAASAVAVPAAPAQRIQVPRQSRLFSDTEGAKVLQFPSAIKPVAPKQKARRQGLRPDDNQAFLDFHPPAPQAQRTLKTSVEAVIYCDAPVATPAHRAVGFALDFAIVTIGIAVFLLTFHFC